MWKLFASTAWNEKHTHRPSGRSAKTERGHSWRTPSASLDHCCASKDMSEFIAAVQNRFVFQTCVSRWGGARKLLECRGELLLYPWIDTDQYCILLSATRAFFWLGPPSVSPFLGWWPRKRPGLDLLSNCPGASTISQEIAWGWRWRVAIGAGPMILTPTWQAWLTSSRTGRRCKPREGWQGRKSPPG